MVWRMLGLVFVLGCLRCDLAVEDINSSMLSWLPFSSWCHPSLQGDRIPLISPPQAIDGPSEIPERAWGSDRHLSWGPSHCLQWTGGWGLGLHYSYAFSPSAPIPRCILIYWAERWNKCIEHCWKKTQNDSDWRWIRAHFRDYLTYKVKWPYFSFLHLLIAVQRLCLGWPIPYLNICGPLWRLFRLSGE